MTNSDTIGIVTVTYNSAAVIDDFLSSMLAQTEVDFILYIVDNASTDGTVHRLAKCEDRRVVLIQNSANLGVAEGNNVGIKAALNMGCGRVLLINNDTLFDPGLLATLNQGMERHGCEIAVPKILFFDRPDTIWYGGGYFNSLRGCGNHYGLGKKDCAQYDSPRAVTYSPTCCMLIKRDVFIRVGLMDPIYFIYFDDTDFCLRAFRNGIKLLYLPSAQMLHKVSSLTGGVSEFTLRFITRNHVYYVLKHYPWWRAVSYAIAFYLYLPCKYLLYLRRPGLFAAAHKAFWEGISLHFSNLGRPHRTELTRVP